MSHFFRFLDFQTVAVNLAQQGTEADLRTAVGRLYYALFHVAKERTGAKGKGIHKKVVQAVKKRDNATGNQLDSLRRLRVAADYELVPKDERISRNWQQNWHTAHTIASHLLPKLWKV